MQAAGSQKWHAVFDYDGQSKVVSSKLLVAVPPETGTHIDERDLAVVVSQNTVYFSCD